MNIFLLNHSFLSILTRLTYKPECRGGYEGSIAELLVSWYVVAASFDVTFHATWFPCQWLALSTTDDSESRRTWKPSNWQVMSQCPSCRPPGIHILLLICSEIAPEASSVSAQLPATIQGRHNWFQFKFLSAKHRQLLLLFNHWQPDSENALCTNWIAVTGRYNVLGY